MRALLDTNIIIHRENKQASNYSIGHLYRWLDELKYDKIIHPASIAEIRQYRDQVVQDAFDVKLNSYKQIQTIKEPDAEFLAILDEGEETANDKVDNTLLYEVYLNRVDIFITEDRKLREKAHRLGLEDRVFSVNSFLGMVTEENPDLVEYKMLEVKKEIFGQIDISDQFFNSFRLAYDGFDRWFHGKCDEEVYTCRSDLGNLLGLLYLKTEGKDENYSDISPRFEPKRRLKVGTFKVESTGFRLGERFIKIIFDNATERNVDEIYMTMFIDSDELLALYDLALSWGFVVHGVKQSNGKEEQVLVKKLKQYDHRQTARMNFPNTLYDVSKFIVPILPQYHTSLLPDSKLNNENEIDFLGREPHRYALQKIYVSWADTNGAKPGDIVLFYRMGEEAGRKKYTSVLTTVAVIDEIVENINSEEKLLTVCQNRSVFSKEDLRYFWLKKRRGLKVIKFIFVKSLSKRLILDDLWKLGVITPGEGPRPFTLLKKEDYDIIINNSETELTYIDL